MKKRWMALLLALCVLAMGTPAAMADSWQYDAQTTLYGSGSRKLHNLQLAVEALDGTKVYFGETFSFNEVIGPREKELGYKTAKNGRGAYVTGGGVSQLATTLYLAARDCGFLALESFDTYDEKFSEWYVEDGYDAIITDYDSGKDFSFTSWHEGVLYISAWMDEEYVYCSLEFAEDVYTQENEHLISEALTPVYGSENKIHNICLASEAIDGTVLEFGETFSFNNIVGPRSKEAGYRSAVNGRGAKVTGGGVAQVASTVYLAVKELDCVAVDPVRTYGEHFSDGYVSDPADAVVTDYNSGYDLSFTYWGYGTLEIYLYEDGESLICEIYEY